jgi:hypothetical protein|tara:strand:- start:2261 stop:3157 length:897 start_codon:yes stop_codon:yes gene_type:complete
MKKHEKLVQETQLRSLIRKAIKYKIAQEKKETLLEENKLRKIIRFLIKEGDIDADTNPVPYSSTPLNALADAFNQILPVLKTGLRGLEKPGERASYRMHILEKLKSTFDRFEGFDRKESGAIGESDINEQELEVDIDNRPDPAMVMPSDSSEEERFKPKEKSDSDKTEDEFESERMPDEDPTGARWAFETWSDSNIEHVLSDKRKLLRSDEYKQEFKEYCLFNADLWMLTYEKEFADEKGQEMAFTETIMPRPSGAEISPAAQEFGTETPEEEVEEILPDPTATMSDLPDVGADVGVA